MKPLEKRFWAKVEKTTSCWVWTAYVGRDGHGRLSTRRGRGPVLAHRLSWALHFGEVPEGNVVVQTCGNPACVRPSHLALKRKGGSVASRLSVNSQEGPNGCLLWTGATAHGYGNMNLGRGKWRLVHQLAWEVHRGPVPEDKWVLHSCDTPLCINPEHLFLGNHADNMRDMAEKGRSPHGERHHNARLSTDMVRDIRTRHAAGEKRGVLASEFGVSPGHLSRIVNYTAWRHEA